MNQTATPASTKRFTRATHGEFFQLYLLLFLSVLLSFFAVVWNCKELLAKDFFLLCFSASQNIQKQTMRNRTIITSLLLFYRKFHHFKRIKISLIIFFYFLGTRSFFSSFSTVVVVFFFAAPNSNFICK